MATLFGGINRGAVAPEMMEYGDKLDQQLNDPNAYYNMPDENLLLHTNRAFDMADRGQIARSEVPVVGYLNSNMKDTATREQALGMDLMNRKRFANKQNQAQPLSPEQFTKSMADNIQAQNQSAQAMSNMDAGLEAGQIKTTQAGTLGGQPVVAQHTENVVQPTPTLQGVTPEMMESMAQANQIGGVSTLGNQMMYNPNVSYGRGGRELGQSDMGSNPMEAMAYAKALGWNAKDYTTVEKRVNPKTGNTEERTISQEPFLQEGYDENMNISTPRIGLERVESPWKVTKKFVPKKSGSGKTPPKKTFKKTSKPSTIKDNVVDEMARNQKFINFTDGKSEATKQSLKEFSKLSHHKIMMENLDEEQREDYVIDNDLGETSYTTIVEQLDNLGKNLKASGLDINNEVGASMYNDSYSSAMGKYEKHTPIGMTEEIDVTFKGNDRIDIDDGYNKRNLPVGSDKRGNEYIKISMKNADTGMIEEKLFPVKDLTEQKKTELLSTFSKSGANYYGTIGTGVTKGEQTDKAQSVSYLGSEKERQAYEKGKLKFDNFNNRMLSVTDMDEARDLYEDYKKDIDTELKDHPEMARTFGFGAYPQDRNKDGIPDAISEEKKGKLLSVFDKKMSREKGFGAKQKKIVNKNIGQTKEVEIGEIGGKSRKMKYMLKPTDDGVKVTIVSNKGKTKELPNLVSLNFTKEDDINTRAEEIILDYMKKVDPNLNTSKVIKNRKITFLK